MGARAGEQAGSGFNFFFLHITILFHQRNNISAVLLFTLYILHIFYIVVL